MVLRLKGVGEFLRPLLLGSAGDRRCDPLQSVRRECTFHDSDLDEGVAEEAGKALEPPWIYMNRSEAYQAVFDRDHADGSTFLGQDRTCCPRLS